MAPLISVLMPNYNNEAHLADAIGSILAQSVRDFELIIVDDASKDASWRIIRAAAKRDKRISAFRNKRNSGISASLNKALRHAKGRFFARMDGDDTCSPKRFEKQLAVLRKHPEKDLVVTDMNYIDEAGKTVGKRTYDIDRFDETIHIKSPVAHATVFARREAYDSVGEYNTAFDGAEDYDLWFRMSLAGMTFAHLSERLYDYRLQPTSTKSRGITRQLKRVIKLKEHARTAYGWRFSWKGRIRLFLERVLSRMPDWFVMRIYHLTYVER